MTRSMSQPSVSQLQILVVTVWVQHVLGALAGSDSQPLAPALIIIGDSTVDVGNNNGLGTIIKSNFRPYGRDFSEGPTGRFCNGKIIPDFVAEYLGVPYPLAYLDPRATGSTILTGINTASSASGLYELTAKSFNVVPLSEQFEWLRDWEKQVTDQVGPSRANTIFTEAVWVLSTGSNDYVNNYFLNPLLQAKFTVQDYTRMLVGLTLDTIKQMYALGARRMAVVGLPPLGCIPAQIHLNLQTDKCIDDLNKVAVDHNSAVTIALDHLKPSLVDAKILLIDTYSYIYDAFQNPAKYGITKTADACCGTGTVEVAILCNEASPGTCQNADEYLFWDSFHPTSKFNAGLAKQIIDLALIEFGL